MSSDIQNYEEHQSFWKKTLIGIPYWLIALIIIIIILYWAYKQGYFNSLGLSNNKSNVSFAQKDILNPAATISPVETKLGL